MPLTVWALLVLWLVYDQWRRPKVEVAGVDVWPVVIAGLGVGLLWPLGGAWWPSGLGLALGAWALLFATLGPLGMGIGFLGRPQWGWPGWRDVVAAPVIYLGVALPEELVWRAGVQAAIGGELGLAVASAGFGLSHWNNITGHGRPNWRYVAMATLAGLVYGLVFMWAGVWWAALTHALVDATWRFIWR